MTWMSVSMDQGALPVTTPVHSCVLRSAESLRSSSGILSRNMAILVVSSQPLLQGRISWRRRSVRQAASQATSDMPIVRSLRSLKAFSAWAIWEGERASRSQMARKRWWQSVSFVAGIFATRLVTMSAVLSRASRMVTASH